MTFLSKLFALFLVLCQAQFAFAVGNKFSSDLEEGDLSEWTDQNVEAGNTVEASIAAVKNGTYGLRIVAGATSDDGRTNFDLGVGGTETQLFSVFWFKVVTDVTTSGNKGIYVNSDTHDSTGGGLVGIKTVAPNTNNLIVWDGGAWDNDDGTRGVFNFTNDTWYGVRVRVQVESIATANDGQVEVQTSANGTDWTLRFLRTDMNISATAMRYIRAGGDFAIEEYEVYFDDIDVDDTDYPTLNLGGGGDTPQTGEHLKSRIFLYD